MAVARLGGGKSLRDALPLTFRWSDGKTGDDSLFVGRIRQGEIKRSIS